MRDVSEVKSRIESLVQEEIDRRVHDASQQLPHHCEHNFRQPLDSRKRVQGEPNPNYNRISSGSSLPVIQTIGLCKLSLEDPAEWPGTICEDPLDAKRCPLFSSALSKDEVVSAAKAQMEDSEWVRTNLPALHELLWVIGDVTVKVSRLQRWKRRLLWWRKEPLLLTGGT